MAGDHFCGLWWKSARAAGGRAKRRSGETTSSNNRVPSTKICWPWRLGSEKSANVIKADVQGSVWSSCCFPSKIEVEGVKVTIVHSAVGAINESDIDLQKLRIPSSSSPSYSTSTSSWRADEVEIRLHSIIQSDWRNGRCHERVCWIWVRRESDREAVIRETFKVSKIKVPLVVMVLSGRLHVIPKSVSFVTVSWSASWSSCKQKHFKDDVKDHKWSWRWIDEGYNDIKTDRPTWKPHQREKKVKIRNATKEKRGIFSDFPG